LRRSLITFCILAAAACCAPARASEHGHKAEVETPPPPPLPPPSQLSNELYSAIQDLLESQDRVVDGAAETQTKLLARIEAIVPTLTPEDWKQQRNYRAVVVYVLAGGAPTAVEALLAEHVVDEKDTPLLAASIAFAHGEKDKALKLMTTIDPKRFPPILAGHLALVEGGLLVGSDNKRASALFDYARLVMPGSLVEEAAIRRELAILDPIQEHTRYLTLAARYQHRFARSPFAPKYWRSLSAAILKGALTMEPWLLSEYEQLFTDAPQGVGFEFHTALTRASLLLSSPEMVKAEAKAAGEAADTPQARERLKVYRALTLSMDGDTAGSAAELKSIDLSVLKREELSLLRALQGVDTRLADGAPIAKAEPATESDAEPAIVQSLQQSLAESEALLKRADRP